MQIGFYIQDKIAPDYNVSAIELAYRLGGPFDEERQLSDEWLSSDADEEFIYSAMSVLPGRGSYGEPLDSKSCKYIEQLFSGRTFNDFADLVEQVAIKKLTDCGLSEEEARDAIEYENSFFEKDSDIYKAATNIARSCEYECVAPSYKPYDL